MTPPLHRISVQGGGSFGCSEAERILIAMERAGQNGIPVGCRGGGCGICRVRVLEGEYTTGKMSSVHVSAEDLRQNCVLACRLYPRSDMVLKTERRPV